VGRLRIRVAEPEDWPAIEAWRETHFANIAARSANPRPITGQVGLHGALWLVAEKEGRPVAAIAYTERPHDRIRFLTDLYAEPGLPGGLAAVALGEYVERMSDDQGYELRANTDPENLGYIEVLLRRGYEIVAVELKRAARQAVEEATVR